MLIFEIGGIAATYYSYPASVFYDSARAALEISSRALCSMTGGRIQIHVNRKIGRTLLRSRQLHPMANSEITGLSLGD
jgi:hypothetical protein